MVAKNNKKETAFPANEVMMMLEQMNDGIAIIAEQGNDNANRMKTIEKKIDTMQDDICVLKEDVAILKEDVAVLKKDATVLKEDVAEIKLNLSNKVNRDEFEGSENRILKLEKLTFAK